MSNSQSNRHFRRAKAVDAAARWGITLGGVLVVLATIGIFVEIAAVTLPLFAGARSERVAEIAREPGTSAGLAAGIDDYGRTAWRLHRDGSVTFYDVAAGTVVTAVSLYNEPVTIGTAVRLGPKRVALAGVDGRVAIADIDVVPQFDAAGNRRLEPQAQLLPSVGWRLPPQATLVGAAQHEERAVLVARDSFGNAVIWSSQQSASLLGGSETVTALTHVPVTSDATYTLAAVGHEGTQVALARNDSVLERFTLQDTGEATRLSVTNMGRGISALAYLLGDISLAVAHADGTLGIWFDVRGTSGIKSLQPVHRLDPLAGAATAALAAPHMKAVATVDALGVAHIDHATSNRRLLSLATDEPLDTVAFNSRGDGLAGLDVRGNVHIWRLHMPHPEVSVGTLFGKIWYEGYDAPAYVWQSSAGSADFEPKLSLVPLLFGTLKATFYAMFFSLPVALLAAIYASQFLGRRYHRIVKPIVELMAAFPSVVIGFLAALWLAPKLEGNVVGFAASAIVLPCLWLLWIPVWRRLEARYQRLRARPAAEYLLFLPLLCMGVYMGLALGSALEASWLAGSFQQWLYDTFGARYDQRNSVVIAFALGFAVVPLVFTMADDALSNVPQGLTAASLALGASRWQTVWKVVLPSASPGIFAAIMIGFGRAVGETMIVLMAAGNTPILDVSPFNGMRTLAANIAVEIPEAPHGGTLYRVLFLSALLLFSMTFIANTFAEVARTRLRRRYGRF